MPELHRFPGRLSPDARTRILDSIDDASDREILVTRTGERTISVDVLDDLMREVGRRMREPEWSEERSVSDRWLAPRVHYALRLTRAEAADKGIWLWLALRYHEYVLWRWAPASGSGSVSEDRWYGPVHKQALARLWWGAEQFRNGPDYGPVVRAFVRQDFPNSFLHRPLVRCRSLALGLVEVIAPEKDTEATPPEEDLEAIPAAEVNDLARVLNLAVAGSPPEIETGFLQDDREAYRVWIEQVVTVPPTWDTVPRGPEGVDTTPESVAAGVRIANRGRSYAARARTVAR